MKQAAVDAGSIKSLKNRTLSLAIFTVLFLTSFTAFSQFRFEPIKGKWNYTDSLKFSRYLNNTTEDSVLTIDFLTGKLKLKKFPGGGGGTVDTTAGVTNISTQGYVSRNYQPLLISSSNIRTVNGSTLLGSTNLQVGTLVGNDTVSISNNLISLNGQVISNTNGITVNSASITVKKDKADSTGNPGFTTLFQHNKTRDSLQTLIAANAIAIAGKFTVVSFGKNATNDSNILVLSNGSRYAAIDNNGGTGGGGITSQTIVTANGFSGTSTGGATPAITLTTPLNTIVKGNGTALVNAVAGTDYVIPSALTPLAPLASPALTSIPTAPTAAVGTNTTQIATMAALAAGLAANVDPMAISYGLILDTPSTKRLRIDPIIAAKVGDSLNAVKYVSINNIDTIKNTKIFKNLLSSDNPTYGSDISGSGNGTGYTGTVFNTGITHTGGTTSFIGTFIPTAGQFYKISMVSTGITTSSSQFTFGGYVLGIGANGTVNTVWKATSAAPPTLIPFATGADGTITVTIQQMTGGTTPYLKVFSASGVLLNEQRQIGSNYFVGIGQGLYTSTLAANNVVISLGSSQITSGSGNVLLSPGAGSSITTGAYNFAALPNALSANNSANFHISIGRNNLDSKVNGDNVISIGSSGTRFIADGVTPYTTGTNSMYLGDNTRAFSNSVTGETVIGINAVGVGNNTMVLGGPAQASTVIPYGTFTVPNLTGGSATDSVLTRDITGLFHIRSASAFGGAGGGSVTVFSKTDGFGITSSVSNPTTTPNHTIATDTTVIQSKAGNVSLLALKENSLGNPSTSGFVLSSTSAGVRSWIAPATGGGGGTVTNVSANAPLSITGGGTISPTVNADTLTTAGLQTKFRTDSARANIYSAIASNTTNISANTTAISGKQPLLGFTPYNATNPNGYISSYTETDPIVKAINGIVYSNGTVISAAIPSNFPTLNQSTTGNASTATNLTGLTTTVATLNNQSGINTGDNATNTQYSSLVSNANHSGDVTGSTALTLATVLSTPGSYTNVNLTVDLKGRIIAIASGTGSGGTDKFGEENTGSAATTITLANTAITNTVRLFKNGVRLASAQFSVTGATITLTAARVTTDLFQIDYKF